MAVELNHTIIWVADKWASAKFLADVLGVEAGPEWAHFVPIRLGNGVTLDFAETANPRHQHFAFLVSDAEFDATLARLKRTGAAFYADFERGGGGEINHLYGGRGVYFDDANGHLFELITHPMGRFPNAGPRPEASAGWRAGRVDRRRGAATGRRGSDQPRGPVRDAPSDPDTQ